MAKFRHPLSAYTERVDFVPTFIGTLILGTIYFAIRGVWRHAIASLLFAVLTCGISWFIYPFFAPGIIRRDYLRKGWIRVYGRSQSMNKTQVGVVDQDIKMGQPLYRNPNDGKYYPSNVRSAAA